MFRPQELARAVWRGSGDWGKPSRIFSRSPCFSGATKHSRSCKSRPAEPSPPPQAPASLLPSDPRHIWVGSPGPGWAKGGTAGAREALGQGPEGSFLPPSPSCGGRGPRIAQTSPVCPQLVPGGACLSDPTWSWVGLSGPRRTVFGDAQRPGLPPPALPPPSLGRAPLGYRCC